VHVLIMLASDRKIVLNLLGLLVLGLGLELGNCSVLLLGEKSDYSCSMC
jgi:hypothetical protein